MKCKKGLNQIQHVSVVSTWLFTIHADISDRVIVLACKRQLCFVYSHFLQISNCPPVQLKATESVSWPIWQHPFTRYYRISLKSLRTKKWKGKIAWPSNGRAQRPQFFKLIVRAIIEDLIQLQIAIKIFCCVMSACRHLCYIPIVFLQVKRKHD